jgi:hypothetical protein
MSDEGIDAAMPGGCHLSGVPMPECFYEQDFPFEVVDNMLKCEALVIVLLLIAYYLAFVRPNTDMYVSWLCFTDSPAAEWSLLP